ncbi:MAG TPA: hypothetical protein DD381_04540 [Lentisphaeria bacterium]|nr:MAG: hypothetical protein A2X47_07110 [Lentisphaerae bacterium GWF2_38_69]HBM15601.1 hypothetical protein [Lentisphaeria bacterium]
MNKKSSFILPFTGVRILFRRIGYFRYAWFSALLNLALYIFLVYFLFHFVFPWIDSMFGSHPDSGFLIYLYKTLEYIIKIIISLSVLVISVILFNTIFFSISAPYLDGLSLAIEKDFFGFVPEAAGISGFAKSCLMSIKNGIRLNILTLFWAIVLFPLNFIIPLVGFLPGMLVSSYFLGLSFIIFCPEHRLMNKKEFNKKLSGNRLKVLAFGFVIYLVLFIPFTAIIFIPGAIIGATILYNQEFEKATRI